MLTLYQQNEESNVLEIQGSLLGACRIHKQFQPGKVVEKLLEPETENDTTGYCVALENVRRGEWVNACKVRKQKRKEEISRCINCFVSKEQKCQLCYEIHNMLGKLAMERVIQTNINRAQFKSTDFYQILFK